MRQLFRLYKQRGSGLLSMEVVIMLTVLVIGIVVGGVSSREHVVTEMGDIAVALDNLSQSFSYTIEIDSVGTVLTASYVDPTTATLTDPLDAAPAGLNMDIAPINE